MAIAVSGWNIYSFIINWHHNLNPLLERQPTVDDKCITKIRCVLYLNMKKSCKEKGKWLPQLTGQMAHPARAFKTPWLTRVTKIYIRQPESKPPSHYNVCIYRFLTTLSSWTGHQSNPRSSSFFQVIFNQQACATCLYISEWKEAPWKWSVLPKNT